MSKQLPYHVDLSVGQEIRIRAVEHELHAVRAALLLVAGVLEESGDPAVASRLRELIGSAAPAPAVHREGV